MGVLWNFLLPSDGLVVSCENCANIIQLKEKNQYLLLRTIFLVVKLLFYSE